MWLARHLPSPPRPAWRRVAPFIVALWCMALVTPSAHASDVEEQEALHLQRFIGYIDWHFGAFALPVSAMVVGVRP